MKKLLVLLAVWPLAACVSFNQLQLPNNYAVTHHYPQAVAGDPKAGLALADFYRIDGGGIRRNDAESLRRWLDLAESGNYEAQVALATYYQTVDREQAIYWYLRAEAFSRLANFHADSKLGPPDFRLALKWAYVADYKYLISTYEKQLALDEQAEARRLADEWKAARRPKDSK